MSSSSLIQLARFITKIDRSPKPCSSDCVIMSHIFLCHYHVMNVVYWCVSVLKFRVGGNQIRDSDACRYL